MTSVQDRLKIKRESCDTWSTREQLCLASSVLKSGDQNWISVSRSLKPFAEKEALRPPDWFSQKSCAIQYAILLENADTPKRKKRESGETTGESIVKRLTQERIAELGQILAFQRDEYQQLKAEVNLLKSGSLTDDKLQKMWQTIEQEEREQEQKLKAHSAWLAKRQQKHDSPSPQPAVPIKSTLETNNEVPESVDSTNESEEDTKNKSGPSTLLTSLLKSSNASTQIQNTTSTTQVTSPTIASLLGSNTKVHTIQTSQALTTPQVHQIVTSVMSTATTDRPSAGAPTLSMLLALPANLPRGTLPTLPTPTTQTTSNDSIASSHPGKKMAQGSQSDGENSVKSEITEADSIVGIIDRIDDVIVPDSIGDVIDKDEIDEIMDDIDELIKKDIIITSPQPETAATPPGVVELISATPEKIPQVQERAELKNIDEPELLSHSSESDMTIDDIDQSTTNIAKIIGADIEPIETKKMDQVAEQDIGKSPEDVRAETKEEEKLDEDSMLEVEGTGNQSNIINDVEEEQSITEDKKGNEECAVNDSYIKTPTEFDQQMKSTTANKEEEEEEEEEEEDEGGEAKREGENDQKLCEKPVELEEKTDIKMDAKNLEGSIEKFVENTDDQEAESTNVESEGSKEIVDSPEQVDEEEKVLDNSDDSSEQQEPKDEAPVEEAEGESSEMHENSEQSPNPPEENSEEAKDDDNEQEKSPKKDQKQDEEEEEEEQEETEEEEPEKIEKAENSDPIFSEVIEPKDANTEKAKDSEIPKVDREMNIQNIDIKIEPPSQDEPMESKPIEIQEKIIKQDDKPEEKEVSLIKEETRALKNAEEVKIKKDEPQTTLAEDLEVEEEESSLTKLSASRTMKTYSKKQHIAIDSEPETESSGEGAEYKAWKKSVILVHDRLATHKFASVFQKPITEEQASGYHSVVFRPMDLSTIKKNIDNGTIRSTMHFQRDVMLMFQNAIMYNKRDTVFYERAVSMAEECRQHMQDLVQVIDEASLKRETRTVASSSSETSESSVRKRKRSHITPSPHDTESFRFKKRRKSEND